MIQHSTFWQLVMLIFSVFSMEMEFNINPEDDDALTAAISKAVGEAYEFNKRGLEALELKQYDAALAAFNEAVKMVPDYSDAENNRGVVYYRRGNIVDAQKIWEALAAKDAGYATASYNLGLVYLHDRQYEAALRLFERAVKADSRFVEAIIRCGTTHLELGHRAKSVELLRKAYKIAPKHPDTWSFLAYSLIANGDTTGAVTILKNNESDPQALRLLASIENSRKNSSAAVHYLTSAVAKGADPSILAELAASQLEDGNCKEALAVTQHYFSFPIQHTADAYLTAGIAAKECGKSDEALRYFSEGSKHYRNDPILAYNLGQMYFYQKQYGNAEATWEGLSDSLQDPSLLYLRAVATRKKGDFSGARTLIQKALAMDNRAEFHDFLGSIYFQEKSTDKAREEFKKAIALNPELRSAQLNLALISRSGENLDEMVQQLRQQLNTCSGDSCVTLAFQLSILYYHQKMTNKAVGVLTSLKDSQKDERVYRHIAFFYREMHEWDKAIASLEHAAKNFVLEPQTEYELAESYLFAGDHNKAVERFQSLIPRWTENPWRLYYQMGHAWLEQNNLDKAQECFERSLKSKHDNIAARGLLAFVLNRKGNVGEARKLWEKNLQDDPDNPALWINMGLSLERDKRYEEALSNYKRAAMLNRGDKELQINIGNAYMGMGRYAEAIDAYVPALETSKRDCAAYNIFLASIKKRDRDRAGKMLAILRNEFAGSPYARRSESEMALWEGDTARARKSLESLVEKEDADWLTLARLYAGSGQMQEARDCIAKVASPDLWNVEIKEIEAMIAFGSGDYSNAMRYMRDAGDTSFTARYNLAVTAYHAKQFQQSLDITRRLSKCALGKDRTDVCRLAGNAAFSLKRWEEAKQWYLQLSNVEVSNSVVQYNLAVAFYNLGLIDDSWKYYQRAKGYDSSIFNKDIEAKYRLEKGRVVADSTALMDSADLWYNQAVDLQQKGNDTVAERLYRKVIAKDTGNSLAWNNLGAIYGKRGDIDNAEKAYFKAIEKRHDVPETYANLVNLYIELEEFTKARKWIIKGLGHNPDSEVLATIREKIPAAEEAVEKRKRMEAAAADNAGGHRKER